MICAVCGVHGVLRIENGAIRMKVSVEERVRSDVLLSGKQIHNEDIRGLVARLLSGEYGDLSKKQEKYKNYLSYTKPVR